MGSAFSPGTGKFNFSTTNTCGTTLKTYFVSVKDYSDPACGGVQMFSVSPNPAETYLDIEINESEYKSAQLQSYEIVLLDNTGEVILKTRAGKKTTRIDTSSFKRGFYFVKLTYKGKVFETKAFINK